MNNKQTCSEKDQDDPCENKFYSVKAGHSHLMRKTDNNEYTSVFCLKIKGKMVLFTISVIIYMYVPSMNVKKILLGR